MFDPRLYPGDPALYNARVPFVYILRCGDGSLYTGITRDVERRLAQHQAGKASRYTRSRLPVTLVWTREVGSWSLALREEIRIKALSRRAKEELLALEDDREPSSLPAVEGKLGERGED